LKGFIFTITFAALCYLTLLTAVFYLESRGYAGISQANQTVADANAEVFDDLSSDLMHHLGIEVSSKSLPASNRTNITFTDTIPSTMAFPASEFGDWTGFVEDEFSPASNLNITMNYTDFQVRPRLIASPFNLTYGYSSLDQSQMHINGSGNISNYSLTIRLNRDINSSMTNDSGWNWSGSNTSLFISLDIEDNAGEKIKVKSQTSGYIDPSAGNSVIFFGDPSGNLTIEAGTISGYGANTLRVLPSGLSARTTTSVLLNGTPETLIYAPIWVTVGEQSSNLIVFEDLKKNNPSNPGKFQQAGAAPKQSGCCPYPGHRSGL